MIRVLILLEIILLFFGVTVSSARADDVVLGGKEVKAGTGAETGTEAGTKTEAEMKNCLGGKYRSKKDDVAIYADSDRAAEVIGRLALGEKACYLGEQSGFAIIAWQPPRKLAYVHLTDLWPPRGEQARRGGKDLFQNAADYLNYMRYGGVPDDGLAPYRPLMNPFSNSLKDPGVEENNKQKVPDSCEQNECTP